MKIVYQHRTLGDGAEGIHIMEMINAFQDLGHDVMMLGPHLQTNKTKQKKTIKLEKIKRIVKGPVYELLELGYNLYGYASMGKVIGQFKPDLIYSRYITFNYSPIASGRYKSIPVFVEVNAPLAYERAHESDETLFFQKAARFLERQICKNADKTIVVSTPLKDYLTSNGVPAEKILVMPNGVNTKTFYPKPKSTQLMNKLGLMQHDTVIGFVGILRPWHGLDMLLNAFKQVHEVFPDSKLVLIGDGPIRNDIVKLATGLNLTTCIHITGRIAHKTIGEYISLIDIGVCVKATFYSSPMKILEYMAQQKAVLAPDMTNIRDIIAHRKTGFLFTPEDTQSLVNALKRLISDVKLRDQLAKAGYQATQNRFNWRSNAKQVIEESRMIQP